MSAAPPSAPESEAAPTRSDPCLWRAGSAAPYHEEKRDPQDSGDHRGTSTANTELDLHARLEKQTSEARRPRFTPTRLEVEGSKPDARSGGDAALTFSEDCAAFALSRSPQRSRRARTGPLRQGAATCRQSRAWRDLRREREDSVHQAREPLGGRTARRGSTARCATSCSTRSCSTRSRRPRC